MIRIEELRTPEAQFADLPDYPFAPHYVEINSGDAAGTPLRVHYVDERPSEKAKASGETILLLHGNPSWSYLYRHVSRRCSRLDTVAWPPTWSALVSPTRSPTVLPTPTRVISTGWAKRCSTVSTCVT